MKKYLMPVFILLMMVACSSSEKKYQDDEDAMTVNETPVSGSSSSGKSDPENRKSENTAKKVDNASLGNLMEAIRTGSEEAIYKTSTSVLTQNPNDVKALMALGMYHYKKNRPQLAMYFYNRVLALKAVSSEIYNNIGLANLALKEQKEAIRAFRKAIEINPQNQNAAGNLSSLYLHLRDFSKAYTVLEIAMQKSSKDIRLLTNYAMASAAKGKLEQAESLYRDVLKQNKNYKEGLYNFAVFQIEYQKKMKEGLETIAQLKFLGPGENMKSQIIALEIKANTGLK